MILLSLAAILLGGMSVVSAEPPATQAVSPLDDAKTKHDAAIVEARTAFFLTWQKDQAAYHQAVIVEDEKYIVTLEEAIQAAMVAQDHELARTLLEQKRAADAMLQEHRTEDPAKVLAAFAKTQEDAVKVPEGMAKAHEDAEPGLPVSFVKVKAKGNGIVFICDATGSMMPEFDNLRVELGHAIEGLQPAQSFNVVFFQESAPPLLDKKLLAATAENKKRMYNYVDHYTPRGPTDPMPAIKAAFAMHPDVIFFLCDPSDFPDPKGTIAMFKSLNADGKCRVNTIDFLGDLGDTEGEALLKQIAEDSKGTFTYVSEKELGSEK